jgi:hypothetical protein
VGSARQRARRVNHDIVNDARMQLPQEFRAGQNIAAAAILLQTLPELEEPRGTFTARCRRPDPAVRHQLVKCCVISLPGWLMQEVTQERTGFILVLAVGPYVQQRVCECNVLSCTGGACSRGYKRCERGREAPKSLLEEKLIEASANIRAQMSGCVLRVVRADERE